MSQDVDAYARLQKELLDLERDAERAETFQASEGASLSALESSGLAITRLSLHSVATDAGGRPILQLRTRGGRRLSPARISTGDIVGIRPHARADTAPAALLVEGVLTALDDTSVSVVCDDTPPDHDHPAATFLLLKLSSDVTHRRCTAALSALPRAASDSTHVAHALVGVLLRGDAPRFATPTAEDVLPVGLSRLNERQADAVRTALRAKDLAVVHGPPGTGKTHTVVAYIIAEVERGNRVLVAAPSNVAVDNIAERLARSGRPLRFVRAGHPARIIPSVAKHSLEAQLLQTEQAALARDIRTELDGLEAKIGKTRERGARKAMRVEQRELRKELRKRENLAVKRLLTRMDVVLATISGAGARVLDIAEGSVPFDVVVIDEAAQALEASCWVPLLRARKAVLAGDPYQLAGTVKSALAETRGLKKSILDRVFSTPTLQVAVTMLEKQYRMNSVISTWSSQEFYDGKLLADEAVASHRVADLDTCCSDVDDDQNLVNPFIVIDTAGGDCEEDDLAEEIAQDSSVRSSHAATASRSNAGEAQIICEVINGFVGCGVRRQDIAVISPYSGQVELLRQLIWAKHGRALEVATIDSFQGREKEVVCMSLVRSNEQGDVGFLSDDRRLNVAITRARRCVVVVCDSETVSTHPLLLRMIEYAENYGHYRSAVVDFPEIVGTFSQPRRPKEAIDADQQSASNKKPKGRIKRVDAVSKRGRSGVEKNTRVADSGFSANSDTVNDLKGRLREELRAFVEDASLTQKKFPLELSSLGRRLVHELADEFRVGHETTQIADSRQIRIWKRGVIKTTDRTTSERTKFDERLGEGSASREAKAAPGMYDVLHDDGTNEPENTEVDSETKVEGEPWSAVPIADGSRNPEYKDINALLREVSQSREARKADIRGRNTAAIDSGGGSSASGLSKKKKKKRRGNNRRHESESDEDFDAVLAKYGAKQDMAGAGGSNDLVQQITNGRLTTKAIAPKVNREAKQRLAAKLSKEAEKRTRKAKK